MGWLARLFGREHPKAESDAKEIVKNDMMALSNDDLPTDYSQDDALGSTSGTMLHATNDTLAHLVSALQHTNERLDGLYALLQRNANARSSSDVTASYLSGREDMQRAIEYALAHVYNLIRRRGDEIQVPAAMLRQTPDGNTLLPLDPRQQYLLLIMNPLYPHLYATQMLLPSTYTYIDKLNRLPNNVQTLALHINTRKAPPGFIDALWALCSGNASNLFLGKLEPSNDEVSPHTLEYFRYTGSDIRNPKPDTFPDELMLYFHVQPQPFIMRQNLPPAEEIFASLEALEHNNNQQNQADSHNLYT